MQKVRHCEENTVVYSELTGEAMQPTYHYDTSSSEWNDKNILYGAFQCHSLRMETTVA